MASSFYTNTLHVDFDSVLAMDNPVMVSVFNALMASGLEGFLDCPAVLYEGALLYFFNNGSVRDDLVVSSVNGVPVEIMEQLLAETFELPFDGLSEFSEIPRDKVFDSRSIVSLSGEPVAATRNDFLEFSAQAQQTLNIIIDQLSELVAYINRGGNDKNGEVSSIRPPPDDQNRESGNTGGGGDTDRNIVERLITADRERERSRRNRTVGLCRGNQQLDSSRAISSCISFRRKHLSVSVLRIAKRQRLDKSKRQRSNKLKRQRIELALGFSR
ncbi:protein transport protein sec31-like [Dorcoceras hygrometricum]|uniref:Protein transport protein sec31-like n=1 Tax=Dorcoceras hygrometricum TaxID=472368 RepID=A0A2Z7A609_9LAMI|nr:protein transport protein sec31-like [Dorcoceras hygrometricum]